MLCLIPLVFLEKLGSFDVFLHEMNKFCKKKHLLCKANVFKYIVIKILLICSQRCSLKYINVYFNNLSRITPVSRLIQSDEMHFFHISY